MHDITHASKEMQQCIENCQGCHTICLQTIDHCLAMGGKHAESAHIQLLMDCAQICQTSADYMLRKSPFHGRTCAVCAEVCERCAKDCERLGGDDAQMKSCADACHRCAETCRQMTSTMSAQ